MLKAHWKELDFQFRSPAGTSRGTLLRKKSWFLLISDADQPEQTGIGEISIIPGLSPDKSEAIPAMLSLLCASINQHSAWRDAFGQAFPAIQFALETALADLDNGGKRILFDTAFSRGEAGISTNGLVWMGNFDEMKERVVKKIEDGFKVIKLKVGAIDFEQELQLLRFIRNTFPDENLEIRLDANGAFKPGDALKKIAELAQFNIHSIEQPIMPGQHDRMSVICKQSPIPVALDEELIGLSNKLDKIQLLETLKPAYLILKPSLIGGLRQADEWIGIAEANNIGWWATSALESNIGLNAIAQWAVSKEVTMPQGLGTAQLYVSNFESPLLVEHAKLFHKNNIPWKLNPLI